MLYYDDDGNEINPDVVTKPGLCVTCKKDGDPSEEALCTMTRMDQQDEPEFRCDTYDPKSVGSLDR